MEKIVRIVGGGLAGTEAAYQLARRNVAVELYEMRPHRMTEAHATGNFGELVCSNSLRSGLLTAPAGVLKEEMRRLDSLVIRVAEDNRVPAGSALAVDRESFARALTQAVEALPKVRIHREEVKDIPSGIVILATGPLTSPALSQQLVSLLGSQHLYFYDAISPIVSAESINLNVAFRAARYEKGDDDYLNLPLTREEYHHFIDALLIAERVPTHSFERFVPFEGCMPIEEIADRGKETLAFGPMRAVGLIDPRSGQRPYAVVQLRQENQETTLYNLVGFQTKMTYAEQRRVFAMIPGLENAEFVRLGSLHRNTFINSPKHLLPTLQWRQRSNLFFAGQMTGVEGYIESAATGLLAGVNAARLIAEEPPVVPPPTTALGALLRYITDPERKSFQPMNVNFGLLPPLSEPLRKKAKKEMMAQRALADIEAWVRNTEGGEAFVPLGRLQRALGGRAMTARRFAFIDIGTNTILCLIAELKNDGSFDVLDDLAEITRLGQGVHQACRISPEGEERSLKVLQRYLERCKRLNVEEIIAVGTSALRDARNSAEVRARFKGQLGLDVRVISGDEEAGYSFLAVQKGLPLNHRELLVVDVGGGSTEFIRGNVAGVVEAISINVGSVRLTEQFLHSDPVQSEECEKMVVAIEKELTRLPNQWLKDGSILTLVGIAGTFTTLAAVEKKLVCYTHGKVHGSRLTLSEVRRQVALFQGKTIAERKAIPGLEPKRADVILAGACLIERIMTLFHSERVIVSDQGVRYGLLHECLKTSQITVDISR